MTPAEDFALFVRDLGLASGQHVILHAAFRRIRSAFPGLRIERMIQTLQEILTPRGSLLVPSFTYCFKKQQGHSAVFMREETPSVVGAIAEAFRTMPGVVRTSSPTHSFCLWGAATGEISSDNSPSSPLGKRSALDWMAGRNEAYTLMLGADFSSLSFGHYIEGKAPVPWVNYSPWPKGDFLNVGVSATGEMPLTEVPRCSRQFTAFEQDLLQRRSITGVVRGPLRAYFIPVRTLLAEGVVFFRLHADRLLCPPGECDLCDARRTAFRVS
jgi:aminoglycoside N3'-acetyltransferase